MLFELEGKSDRIIWVLRYYIIKMIFKCNLDCTNKKVSLYAYRESKSQEANGKKQIALTWKACANLSC